MMHATVLPASVSPSSWHYSATQVLLMPTTARMSQKVERGFRRQLRGIRAVQGTLVLDYSAEVKEVETLALRLARQAGAIIQEKSGHAMQIESKSSRSDLVTEVDQACEKFIQTEVKASFPNHRWLGEETVTAAKLERLEDGPCSSEWTWIVDPIDGTLNFIGGVPFASVSIAVARGSDVEVGIIYNPFIDELFQATKGHGAFLNGKKISVLPHETELEDAIVTLGFTSKPERRLRMLEAITKVGPHCRAVRALGSAALHICYVAAGRVGCFFERDLKPWDIAAARLVLEEAGGYVSGMDGKPLPLSGGSILATNGGILHDRIVQLLL
ncbi:unnamed protein product [Calypogeia fissa]